MQRGSFIYAPLVAAVTVAILWYGTQEVVASKDPIPYCPTPVTKRQSYCSNDYYTCRDSTCTNAVQGCVNLPSLQVCGGVGSGKFVATPTKLYVCKPSENPKDTCTEFGQECGRYILYVLSNCNMLLYDRPGFQITCR